MRDGAGQNRLDKIKPRVVERKSTGEQFQRVGVLERVLCVGGVSKPGLSFCWIGLD